MKTTKKETYWSQRVSNYEERQEYVVGKEVIRQAKDMLEAEDNFMHVLELGCGTGLYTEILAKKARQVTATDYSDEMIAMAEKNIPVIHLLNINQLARRYGLPVNPIPLPAAGQGDIFIQKRYSVILTAGVTLFLILAIAFVFIMERKRHQLGTEQVVMQRTDIIPEL